MELGIYTFADTALGPRSDGAVDTRQRLRNLLEEIELAAAGAAAS